MILRSLTPYFRILRVKEQSTALVALFFGALDASHLDLANLLIIAAGFFTLSVSSFIINEYIDAKDTDKYSARVRSLTHQPVVGRIVFIFWIFFVLLGSAVLFWYQLYWQALATVVLGTAYSLPPVRLKAKFAFDMLCIYLYLIVIPYSIGFSLNGLPFDAMIQIPFIALSLFLGTAEGVHLLGDLEADRKGGLNNTPVVLGYQNLIKTVIILAFGATFGFMYLLYQHTHWWYYPLIFFSLLAILALGYARGNLYNVHKLVARFSWATKKAVSFGNYVFVYQIVIIYLLSR